MKVCQIYSCAFHDYTLLSFNIGQGGSDDAGIYVQDLHRLINQVIVRKIYMTLLGKFPKHIEYACLCANCRVLWYAEFPRDLVSSEEPYAENIVSKAKRVFLYNP